MQTSSYPELVDAWRGVCLTDLPYILKGDETLREKYRGRDLIHSYQTFEQFLLDPEHGRQVGTIFHTGLLPSPHVGNLENAKVFILMGNPGFGSHNYYAECEVADFRAAKIRNLQQRNSADDYPFLYLNPRFGWHGGSVYWRKKFADILFRSSNSYVDTLQFMSKNVAILETIPYHSIKMGCPDVVLKKLRSVQLMRNYVHNDLIFRARKGEIAILSLRGNWGLDKEEENIVVYTGTEKVSAHLTLASRGGGKLVDFLGISLKPEVNKRRHLRKSISNIPTL